MNEDTNLSREIPPAEILEQLTPYIYQVGVLRAALELEVWAKVASGEDSTEKIIDTENWDSFGTRMLLDDLCSLKLLVKEGCKYRLTPETEQYLLPGKPTYLGKYILKDFCWEGNGRLAEAIRTGNRPIGCSATTTESIDYWIAEYSRNCVAPEKYLKECDDMWHALSIQGRSGLRVLDLACGPAPRSLALARTNLGVRVTLVDWKQILQVAHKFAVDLGIEKQISFLPGDMSCVDFGFSQYDVAFLGGIAHFFSPDQNIRLFRKVYDALVDGGTIVIKTFRRENHDPMIPELWFYAVSANGAIYDFQEYKEMLEGAGYTEVVDINPPIKATKRL